MLYPRKEEKPVASKLWTSGPPKEWPRFPPYDPVGSVYTWGEEEDLSLPSRDHDSLRPGQGETDQVRPDRRFKLAV